jgi:hypothetical protein
VHAYIEGLLSPSQKACSKAQSKTQQSMTQQSMTASNQETSCQAPKLVFALDFHSTQQDIFYTMPNDYDLAPGDFADSWLAQVKAKSLSSFVVRTRPGSSPGRGVFKQFIADHYKVHAVTYEMGDNTPPALVKHLAQVSAQTLMSELLKREPAEFVLKD